MKKILFLSIVLTMVMVSCGKSTQGAQVASDSTVVSDTLAVSDSVSVDTVKVDTVK